MMGHARLLIAVWAGLSGAAVAPDVPEIVRQSTEEIAEDWNQAPRYSFIERDFESKRDAAPSARTYQVLMLDGSPYEKLIALGDQPLSPGEQAEQTQKLRMEIRRRQGQSERERAKRLEKYLRQRHQDRALLEGMLSAFEFRLAGEAAVDGHDCWLLDAIPKPGYEPVSRETKVLKGMRGRLWIDKRSGQWAKVQAEVIQPVSLYGFFAKVRPGTRFELEQERITDSLWLPKHFRTEVKASALGFLNEDSVDDETYSSYQPMPQTLAQIGSQQ